MKLAERSQLKSKVRSMKYENDGMNPISLSAACCLLPAACFLTERSQMKAKVRSMKYENDGTKPILPASCPLPPASCPLFLFNEADFGIGGVSK